MIRFINRVLVSALSMTLFVVIVGRMTDNRSVEDWSYLYAGWIGCLIYYSLKNKKKC